MSEIIWTATAGSVSVTGLLSSRMTVLRVRRPTEEAINTISALLGLSLPVAPNTVAVGAIRILWLAPGEWLILGNIPDDTIIRALSESSLLHLANITDGRTAYRIAGAHAAELLAKGCTLDFHPRAFAVQTCAQSALAQAFVVIERTRADAFDVYADRSFAPHLELWFEDALVEFQQRNDK